MFGLSRSTVHIKPQALIIACKSQFNHERDDANPSFLETSRFLDVFNLSSHHNLGRVASGLTGIRLPPNVIGTWQACGPLNKAGNGSSWVAHT